MGDRSEGILSLRAKEERLIYGVLDVIGLGRKFILRCNRNIGGGSEALFQCYGLIPHASSSIFLHHKFHTIYLVLLFDCSKEDVFYLLGIS